MNKVKNTCDKLVPFVLLLVALVMACHLTGCANWQGAEFRIGIGSYNGASETKTYTKTGVNK